MKGRVQGVHGGGGVSPVSSQFCERYISSYETKTTTFYDKADLYVFVGLPLLLPVSRLTLLGPVITSTSFILLSLCSCLV